MYVTETWWRFGIDCSMWSSQLCMLVLFDVTGVLCRFGIDCSTWSKQLPTVILFQEGKEHIRRPVSTKKTTLKFLFTKVKQECITCITQGYMVRSQS